MIGCFLSAMSGFCDRAEKLTTGGTGSVPGLDAAGFPSFGCSLVSVFDLAIFFLLFGALHLEKNERVGWRKESCQLGEEPTNPSSHSNPSETHRLHGRWLSHEL